MTPDKFIAGLPTWVERSDLGTFQKEALLAAEVQLPVPSGFTGSLVAISIRRPFRSQSELIAVDVSRLPAL